VATQSHRAGSVVDHLALRRAALWGILAAKLVSGWGVRWDIQWHLLIGRDSFWIPPHLMTYAGVSAVVLLSFGVLLWETGRGGRRRAETRQVLGLVGTPGFHVAAWGAAIIVAAAPIDDLWHRLFGLDVTIWSPPHLMGFLGGLVSTVGALVIAREVYPAESRARLAALVIGGAWLYGALHPVIEPALLLAYRHGGVRFHAYGVLAAGLLPLALIPAARLAGRRWAPAALVVVLLLAQAAGGQIARAGFAWLEPEPAIEAAIAADPESPIAVAHEIARKSGSSPGRLGPGALLALVPALFVVAVDARRRPVAASLVHAAAFFALAGWGLARGPAFQPLVPGSLETGGAFAVALAAGALGGLAARRLADAIGASAEASAAPSEGEPVVGERSGVTRREVAP
jgi:hypothetical protein